MDDRSETHGFLHRVAVQLGLLDDGPGADEVGQLQKRIAALEARVAKLEGRATSP